MNFINQKHNLIPYKTPFTYFKFGFTNNYVFNVDIISYRNIQNEIKDVDFRLNSVKNFDYSGAFNRLEIMRDLVKDNPYCDFIGITAEAYFDKIVRKEFLGYRVIHLMEKPEFYQSEKLMLAKSILDRCEMKPQLKCKVDSYLVNQETEQFKAVICLLMMLNRASIQMRNSYNLRLLAESPEQKFETKKGLYV